MIEDAYMAMLVSGVLLGIGGSVCSTCCLPICWKHFPHKCGLITGILSAGWSVGAMVIQPAVAYLNNPEDIGAIVYEGEPYYPFKVTENYISAVWTLTLIYLIFGTTALFLMS